MEKVERLSELFKEAGHAHHQAFLSTKGADAEWPLWYADYLYEKLSELFTKELTKSELVYALVLMDKIKPEKAPDAFWPDFYARYMIEMYG